jgi:signal transduction histidine kinase
LANHDLRQPLGSLALLASALKSDCTPTQRRAIAVRIELVARSLEMMLDHINRLSLLSNSSGTPEGTLLPRPLRAVIDELTPAASEAGINLQPIGFEQPGVAVQVRISPNILADLLRAMVLYAIKLGTGHTIDIEFRRRGRHAYVDVGFVGPDPTGAMQRQAFVELVARDGMPDQLIQGLGLAMASAVASHLDMALSAGRLRGGRQRLTLRIALPPLAMAQ